MRAPERRAPATASVVVCAFSDERRWALQESVRSLRSQSSEPVEVIVVIDHNPRLLEWARMTLDGEYVLPNVERAGLAGARNTGVQVARGDVVAFLDDDAVAAPDWIETLLAAYDDDAVIGVGGTAAPLFDGARPRWMPEEFDWVVGCTYRGLPTGRRSVRNLIGCNMSFRRDVLLRSGGFRHGLGRTGSDRFGCEETELCIRLGDEDPECEIRYEPAARVGHRVPRERATLGYFVSRCRAEGLSKAQVARQCGRSRGLESERAYTRQTLPAGVRAGLTSSFRGEVGGLARAGAIALGLAATASGFASGSYGRGRTR